MGLFDLFKKKKDDKPAEEIAQAAEVQAQPTDVSTELAATPAVTATPTADINSTSSSDFSSGMNEIPTNTFTPEVPDSIFPVDNAQEENTEPLSGEEVPVTPEAPQEASDVQEQQQIESNYFGVPDSNFGSVPGTGEGDLNTVIDNTNPVEVEQQTLEEQKSDSQDIVPTVEDVAALIDDPIAAKSEEENMSVDPETVFEGGETKEVEAVSDDFEDTLFEKNDDIKDFSEESNDEINDFSNDSNEEMKDFSNENSEDDIINVADLIPSINEDNNSSFADLDLNNDQENNEIEEEQEDSSIPHLDFIQNNSEFNMDEEKTTEEEAPVELDNPSEEEVVVPDFEQEEGPFVEEEPSISNGSDFVELNGITDEDIEQEQKEVEEEPFTDDIQTVEDTSEDVIYEDFEAPIEIEKKEEEVDEEEPVVVEEVVEETEPPVLTEEKEFTIFDLPPLKTKDDDEYMPRRVRIEEEAAGIFADDEKKDEDIDINEMYNKLEFKNEKIRFCDTCGAMILDETTNVCPNCGEPL